MAPDEMHHPVMRPAKTVLLEDRVGLGGEVAIGEEQQLDPLPHRFLGLRRYIVLGGCLPVGFYVSHVDISGNLRYKDSVFCDIKFRKAGRARQRRGPGQPSSP